MRASLEKAVKKAGEYGISPVQNILYGEKDWPIATFEPVTLKNGSEGLRFSFVDAEKPAMQLLGYAKKHRNLVVWNLKQSFYKVPSTMFLLLDSADYKVIQEM